MKKLLTISSCILALTVFSFFKNAQTNELKKLGKNLYMVNTTATLKPADQEKLRTILGKQYGIRSFNETVTIHYTKFKGTKNVGNGIAEQRLGSGAFQQTILQDGEQEEVVAKCIYVACSSSPLTSDVIQVLSTYNVR
ncbi:hypothetical protein [Mucilaginibacter gilvus]|uniref:Uncharacterized protein n=1 Tax=Mucilaginibacter gilvus TaxID=2305909 RepID=A0A444MR23_9SPHI|nr:hypothetical protein [Mucilaginibacter gilvus]RWY54070.1 hypothetical protein EPL05_08470 [Mucilaginibacter gilvus]